MNQGRRSRAESSLHVIQLGVAGLAVALAVPLAVGWAIVSAEMQDIIPVTKGG
jgi:hypothetical protein